MDYHPIIIPSCLISYYCAHHVRKITEYSFIVGAFVGATFGINNNHVDQGSNVRIPSQDVGLKGPKIPIMI